MIITYILAGIIVIQSVIYHFERKDLYTRLMCRDVSDYKNANGKNVKSPLSRHREVLDKWRGKGGGKE